MLNSNTNKQRKRFQENRCRYLQQAQPDEIVSSNTELEPQQQDIRVRLERPSKKKVSVKIRNLDIDSDIIKEEDSEDYMSEKQSQEKINNKESNGVLHLIPEEEIESPFKSRINQNQEIFWKSSNQESQNVEAQLFNTPKEHQVADSPKVENAIKSYKNLNTMNSLYSPSKASQKLIINDDTIYSYCIKIFFISEIYDKYLNEQGYQNIYQTKSQLKKKQFYGKELKCLLYIQFWSKFQVLIK